MATEPSPNPSDLPTTRSGAGAPVRIVLARHGEPALSRKINLPPKGYLSWWAQYEAGSLKAGQTPPADLVAIGKAADLIISSTRPRSIESAQAVCGGRAFSSDALFIEAPLPPPPFPSLVRLSPIHWGFLSRFWWWFFNHHGGQESRADATVRAVEAARQLSEMGDQGRDVLVVAHGFFNEMIGLELKRLGWKLVKDQGYNYWSQKHFVRR
jgi:broad specificity phosphatase PhoE